MDEAIREQATRPSTSDRRVSFRRRSLRLAFANAGIWAVGNGLVSSTLVIYLALELGAQGMAISWILAAPRFAGLLRLGVPALIARLQRRKAVCIFSYLASATVLCMVPLVSVPGLLPDVFGVFGVFEGGSMKALVVSWSIYHLLEYVGTISLWSWLGDLTPPRVRGRLLGYRERWLVVGRIVGIVASALLVLLWKWVLPEAGRLQPLAASAAVGALLMIASVVPLLGMTAAQQMPSAIPQRPWRTVARALVDPAYRRLLAFSCWFAVVNGSTAVAQSMYPVRVLGISYEGMQTLRGTMRAGQSAIAPSMGRLTDHFGNRPVMIVAQAVIATGPLFFLAASPERWWLLVGAFLVWILYAGLNVGLDNIKLKLAPPDNNAPYLATYHAISDLANGLAVVAGGLLFDRLREGGHDAMKLYATLFLVGWIGRTLAVVLLARLKEPGARRLGELFRRP